MRTSVWNTAAWIVSAALVLSSAVSAPALAATNDDAAAPDGGAGVPAVWTQKELHFVYQGFTTRYSCDGLRDKIQSVLLQLGARKKDLKVYESGCAVPYGRPDPFPGVRAKMFILQPASESAGAKPSNREEKQAPVPAHWQPVDLKLERNTDYIPSGECELMEQIKTRILPLFTTRGADLKTDCIPYQATPTSPTLRLEVLAPDRKGDKDKEPTGV